MKTLVLNNDVQILVEDMSSVENGFVTYINTYEEADNFRRMWNDENLASFEFDGKAFKGLHAAGMGVYLGANSLVCNLYVASESEFEKQNAKIEELSATLESLMIDVLPALLGEPSFDEE